MTRTIIIAALANVACQFASAENVHPTVTTLRVPNGGIQPQIVVGTDGALHLLYYKGKAGSGDIFYVRSTNQGESFSNPMRVNSQPESAIAAGTIRGAHLAVGKNGRVHVAWNGSGKAKPKGLPFVAIFAVIDCMFADSVGCILSCHFTKRFERNGVTRWF